MGTSLKDKAERKAYWFILLSIICMLIVHFILIIWEYTSF